MSEQDEALQTIAALREAVRARDEFLAIAAHELRNPMHALLLQVTSTLMVAQRAGNEDLIERLERVKRVVDRYVQRATTLLDISRINAGQLRLRPEETDLVEVVREAVDSYATEASFNGADFMISGPACLVGRWDRPAVEQIVSNLVSNAIKYGDAKPVEVSLVREQAVARLVVQDRGIGISPADQARIFGRFEQVVDRGAGSGFGIGLWLVRTLVEAHHGSIEVESTVGEGARFTVRLPLTSSARDSSI